MPLAQPGPGVPLTVTQAQPMLQPDNDHDDTVDYASAFMALELEAERLGITCNWNREGPSCPCPSASTNYMSYMCCDVCVLHYIIIMMMLHRGISV